MRYCISGGRTEAETGKTGIKKDLLQLNAEMFLAKKRGRSDGVLISYGACDRYGVAYERHHILTQTVLRRVELSTYSIPVVYNLADDNDPIVNFPFCGS